MHAVGTAPGYTQETATGGHGSFLHRLFARLSGAPSRTGSDASERTSYLPGLDGLRALAVIAVLLYHARPGWLPGGFLGVEIFFVISGFIITRALLNEWQAHGRIDLRDFWLRRARRLLPAVGLLLAGIMTYVAIFDPGEMARLRGDVLAAVAYVTNWHLILGDQSYFDSFQRPSLLRHLWSLAVEEQFYIVWPLVMAVGLTFLKRRGLAVFILAGIAASATGMALLYDPASDNSRAYFGTDTRAAGLLVGSLLAFAPAAWAPGDATQRGRIALAVLGIGAFGVLAGANYWLHDGRAFLYQGGFLTVSLLTTVVIVAATRRNLLASALSVQPLRWVGVRSYGIYLWHWPIYMLVWPREATLLQLAMQVTAVFVIAALSYALLEKPVREGALGRLWLDVRTWPSRSLRFRGAIVFSGAGTAAAVLGLVAVAALARPPELPAYYQLSNIQIQTAVSGQDVGSVLRRSTLMGEVQTTITTLTDQRTEGEPDCRADHLLAGSSMPLSPGSAFGSACPAPVSLFERPAVLHAAIPETSPYVDLVTEEELGEFLAQSRPDPLDQAGADMVDEPAQTPQTQVPAPEPERAPPPAQAPAAEPPAAPRPAPPSAPPAALQSPPSVTAIGDSVMLGAAYTLAGSIPGIDLDAAVGRQSTSAIALIEQKAAAGRLGQVVVLHIGNNGTLTAREFDRLMAVIGPDRKVVVVNINVPRPWEESNNAVIRDGVSRHANAVLVDWSTAGRSHPELLNKDGIHLTPSGASYYAQLVVSAIGG